MKRVKNKKSYYTISTASIVLNGVKFVMVNKILFFIVLNLGLTCGCLSQIFLKYVERNL